MVSIALYIQLCGSTHRQLVANRKPEVFCNPGLHFFVESEISVHQWLSKKPKKTYMVKQSKKTANEAKMNDLPGCSR